MQILNKVLLIIFWQLAILNFTCCQDGFSKLIDLPHSLSFNFDDVKIIDSELIFRGDSYLSSAQKWGLLICSFDTNGILNWQNTIYSSLHNSNFSTNSPCRFIIYDNKIILPTYYFELDQIGLVFTDSDGNKLSEKDYTHTGLSIFPIKIVELNSEFYIAGRIERSNHLMDDFVLKTDSLGNQIWLKYYGTFTAYEYFGDIIENQGLLTISSMKYSENFWEMPFGQGWIRPWIYTIDTAGNIIEEWVGMNNDSATFAGGPIFRLGNEDWIVLSREFKTTTYNGYEFIASSPTISRLNNSFQLVWKQTVANYTGYSDNLIELEYDDVRNEFVAAGHRVVYYSDTFGALEIWALKFNEHGEIMWSISDTIYSDSINGARHFAAGLEISSSGSIYIAGNVEHESNPYRWYGILMKITPDGCIDTCVVTEVSHVLDKVISYTLFPNPASDKVDIITNEIIKSLEVISIYGQVYDVSFQTQQNSIQLETSLLPNGIYFATVILDNLRSKSFKFIISQ